MRDDNLCNQPDILTEAYANSATLAMGALGLAKGGYALGKGVIGFSKLDRMPVKFSKTVSEEIFEGKSAYQWSSPAKRHSVVNGIEYTTHALERMAPRGLIQNGTEVISRGVPPSVVENAINFGVKEIGNTPQENSSHF